MAVKALGKEKVLAVSMPCNSLNSDFEDAKLVSDTFRVKSITVDIKDTFDTLESSINKASDQEISNEAKINMKPRLRMTTLYSIAQTLGYLVIGTGNLSEIMVGYTTKWGDSSYDFNPIGNFTVSEVLEIGRYLGVPERILNKAPSDGLSGKTDEEKMEVKYSEIEEMIETGNTNKEAKEKILEMFEASNHKREKVPIYTFERKNYLIEKELS